MKKLSKVQRKKRRKKIFLSILFALAVGFAIFMIMLKTGFFSINNIRVLGNEKILKNKIVLLSSIEEGENIFKISTREAEKNISTLPYIKDVEVKRKIPAEINIRVEERKPKFQIKNISSFMLFDKEGYMLENINEKDEELTEIIGFNVENKIVGENIFEDKNDTVKVEFIREAERLNILDKANYIDMEDDSNINMLIFDEIELVFGTINNVKYKLSLLDEVLKDISERDLKVKMILMNRGENPVVVLEENEEG